MYNLLPDVDHLRSQSVIVIENTQRRRKGIRRVTLQKGMYTSLYFNFLPANLSLNIIQSRNHYLHNDNFVFRTALRACVCYKLDSGSATLNDCICFYSGISTENYNDFGQNMLQLQRYFNICTLDDYCSRHV